MNWFEFIVAGGIVPAFVAGTLAWIGSRWAGSGWWAGGTSQDAPLAEVPAPSRLDVRAAGGHAWGVAAGMASGYSLFSWTSWVPQTEWHWLPWLGFLAAVGGTLVSAMGDRESHRHRWLILSVAVAATVAGCAAFTLVPDWKSLDEVRLWHRWGLGLSVGTLIVVSGPAARRCPAPLYFGAWWLAIVAAAIILGLSGNLKLAQLAGLVAAASAASALVVTICFRHSAAGSACGFVFVPMQAGLLYLGWMVSFSDVPWFSYTLAAVAPAFLVVPAIAARKPTTTATRLALLSIPILLLAGLAVGLAVLAE